MSGRTAPGCAAAALVTGLLPWLGAGVSSAHNDSSTAPATDSSAYGARAGGALPPLLPNLRSLPARDFSIEMRIGYRWLRFESALANTGIGPLETRPDDRERCPRGQQHASQAIYRDVDRSGRYRRSVDTRRTMRSAGCMVFHPRHDHWHFDAASRYSLLPAEGTQAVSKHRKTSFCLRDSQRAPAPWGAARSYAEFYGSCDRDNPQGITIGWADVYQSFLPGQAMRLPKAMANGRYCVRVRVDPLDQLRESDDTDNDSIRAILIRNRTVSTIERRFCR